MSQEPATARLDSRGIREQIHFEMAKARIEKMETGRSIGAKPWHGK